MPIYNGSEFFQQSYNSILNQTFENWELLIGINGHEFKSQIYQNIKSIVEKEQRVRLFEFPEFRSKSKTLNVLKQLSQNEVLCILDVDDYWKEDKLEKQFFLMEYYDIVGTGCQYFGDSQIIPNIPYGQIPSQTFKLYNPIINSSSMFFRKDALWNEEIEALEDYEMWLRLNKQNKKFFNIRDVLCYHRIHKNSFFNTKESNVIQSQIKNKWKI